MRPACAIDDAGNSSPFDRIMKSYFIVRVLSRSSKFTNLMHVICSQFRNTITFTKVGLSAKLIESMAHIFFPSNPSQIDKMIIIADSVFVISFQALWTRAYKCLKNKLVAFDAFYVSMNAKTKLYVSRFEFLWHKNVIGSCALCISSSSDASTIAHLIYIFVTINSLPDFHVILQKCKRHRAILASSQRQVPDGVIADLDFKCKFLDAVTSRLYPELPIMANRRELARG